MAGERPHQDAVNVDISNRLWRLEQRQDDIFVRLERIDGRIEPIAKATEQMSWRLDNLMTRCIDCERRIGELERARATGGAVGLLGDSTFMKTIMLALLAAVIALATGQVIDFGGF